MHVNVQRQGTNYKEYGQTGIFPLILLFSNPAIPQTSDL